MKKSAPAGVVVVAAGRSRPGFPPIWIPTTKIARIPVVGQPARPGTLAGEAHRARKMASRQIWCRQPPRQPREAPGHRRSVDHPTRSPAPRPPHCSPQVTRGLAGGRRPDPRPSDVNQSSACPAAAVPGCAMGLARRQPRAAARGRGEGEGLLRRGGSCPETPTRGGAGEGRGALVQLIQLHRAV